MCLYCKCEGVHWEGGSDGGRTKTHNPVERKTCLLQLKVIREKKNGIVIVVKHLNLDVSPSGGENIEVIPTENKSFTQNTSVGT